MTYRKILVTGSRNWADRQIIWEAIREVADPDPHSNILIQGECPYGGADLIAKEIALEMEMPVLCYPAKFKSMGKPAGPIRNMKMVALRPEIVLGFPLEGSIGTWHCLNEARGHLIPARVYSEDGSWKWHER